MALSRRRAGVPVYVGKLASKKNCFQKAKSLVLAESRVHWKKVLPRGRGARVAEQMLVGAALACCLDKHCQTQFYGSNDFIMKIAALLFLNHANGPPLTPAVLVFVTALAVGDEELQDSELGLQDQLSNLV